MTIVAGPPTRARATRAAAEYMTTRRPRLRRPFARPRPVLRLTPSLKGERRDVAEANPIVAWSFRAGPPGGPFADPSGTRPGSGPSLRPLRLTTATALPSRDLAFCFISVARSTRRRWSSRGRPTFVATPIDTLRRA